jgi:iron(III) transport system substrate-binding protein
MGKRLSLALFVALPIFLSSTALAAEAEEVWRDLGKLAGEERERFLVSKAKEEGEAVWYTSLGLDVVEALRADFERRYPGIAMKTWRGRGETVSNRVLAETKAGKFSADVTFSSNEFFPLLIKGNLAARYSSPERAFYSNASKDRDGLWTSVGYVMTVIAYNRNLVPRAEAPRNYEDFLNPKWKGNFAIDSNPDRLVMGWLKLWGGEKTERFLQALIKNDASVRAGHSLMAQLLCAGEFKTAMELYAHRIADLKEKGCPAELVFPGPTIGAGGFLYVAKRAPHPYAAALVMDHLLSARGQRIFADRGFFSGRNDIKPRNPELDLEKRGVRTLLLTPEDVEQVGAKYFELRERYLLLR